MGEHRIRVSIFFMGDLLTHPGQFFSYCKTILSSAIIFLAFFSFITAADAATFNDAANGVWNIGTTWGGACAASCSEGVDYPGSGDDVTIDSGTVTLTADAACNNITVVGGGTLTAQSYIITVSGNWDSSAGTFNYNTSTLKMTGTGKTLKPAGGWATRLYNLTIDTGASVTHTGGVFDIANDITLANNATLTLNTHTFHSQSSGAGNLTISSGATLAINTKFYHFISDGSSHISTTGTISGGGWFIYNAISGSTAAPVTARTYNCDVGVAGAAGAVAALGGGASLNLGSKNLSLWDKGQIGSSFGILDNPSNIPVVSTGILEIADQWDAAAFTGKLIARSANYQFGSVIVRNSGQLDGASGSGASTWTVSGNVTMNSGSTFSAGGSTWNIGGNWTKNGGAFTAGSSTINLIGTNQSISGSSTFYNLTKTITTARTLTFAAGSATTITGTATLQGASGQLLSLASSSPGTRWNLNLSSTASKLISYVSVQDSDASGSDASKKPVNPASSVNSGNNVDWFSYQVDSLIKLPSEGGGSYLTDNVYETTASAQSKSSGVLSGSTASYNVQFQNDSVTTDSIIVTGTGNGSGFTVQYLDDASTDRTAAVTGAGYTISSIASGANKVWTVNATPSGKPSPVAGGTSYNVFVTATSSNDGAKIDQVKTVTSSTSANLTLLKNADKANANPGEEITYSVAAANGSGLTNASSIVMTDPVPTYTGFKVGSATFNSGTSTLTAAISYSNDNGSTWTYTPASSGCSAPSGYDYCVTNIKWTMTGNMPSDTNVSTGFIVRVK